MFTALSITCFSKKTKTKKKHLMISRVNNTHGNILRIPRRKHNYYDIRMSNHYFRNCVRSELRNKNTKSSTQVTIPHFLHYITTPGISHR